MANPPSAQGDGADKRMLDTAGKRKITQVVACKLWQGTGIPARLWLALEKRYRADLKAGKADTTHD